MGQDACCGVQSQDDVPIHEEEVACRIGRTGLRLAVVPGMLTGSPPPANVDMV
jgi:hypothetical protein